MFVVRHAEKELDGGDDPGLTEEGQARAERLAAVFRNAELAAIYASEKRRTYDTAVPAATVHELEIQRFTQVDPDEREAMLESVRGLPPGAVALIVGIHFFPLAELFKVRAYHATGAALCVLALVAFFLGPSARLPVVGMGCAATLYATAAYVLASGGKAVRPDVPAA